MGHRDGLGHPIARNQSVGSPFQASDQTLTRFRPNQILPPPVPKYTRPCGIYFYCLLFLRTFTRSRVTAGGATHSVSNRTTMGTLGTLLDYLWHFPQSGRVQYKGMTVPEF